MTTHAVGTREEHLRARPELLEAEKELTRRSDELAARRRNLPWVRIDKTYRFDTNAGEKTLAELFDGRSQLLVYHFMFGPDWTEGCPVCSFWEDNFNGGVVHLNQRDVTFTCVSRAPLDRINAYKQRMGWSFPWGVVAAQRLQPRLRRVVPRRAGRQLTGRRSALQLHAPTL